LIQLDYVQPAHCANQARHIASVFAFGNNQTLTVMVDAMPAVYHNSDFQQLLHFCPSTALFSPTLRGNMTNINFKA
jgi:hypothetical protein